MVDTNRLFFPEGLTGTFSRLSPISRMSRFSRTGRYSPPRNENRSPILSAVVALHNKINIVVYAELTCAVNV